MRTAGLLIAVLVLLFNCYVSFIICMRIDIPLSPFPSHYKLFTVRVQVQCFGLPAVKLKVPSIISHFHTWTNEVAVGCIQCRRRLCHLSVSLVSVYKKEKKKKFFQWWPSSAISHAVSVINAEVIQYKLLKTDCTKESRV